MDNEYSNIQKGTNNDGICFAFIMTLPTIMETSPAPTTAVVHDSGNKKSNDINKPKNPKCNNVQILVKIPKIPKGSKMWIAQATLDGKTVNKKHYVESDDKVPIPQLYKKFNPCPVVGDSFAGSVNGTNFSGALTSLKKPNKVNVGLS